MRPRRRAVLAPEAAADAGAGPSPRIMTFEARPSSIKPGESVMLVWSTENPAGRRSSPVSVP